MRSLFAILALLAAVDAGARPNCDALGKWVDLIKPSFSKLDVDEQRFAAAVIFADEHFVPAHGKAFGAMTPRERKRAGGVLQDCFEDDTFVRYRLLQKFDDSRWPEEAAGLRRPIEIPLLGVEVTRHYIFREREGIGFGGVKVVRIRDGGPAFLGGIKPGDIISEIGSFTTLNPGVLIDRIQRRYRAGSAATIQTFLEGKRTTHEVLLEPHDSEWLAEGAPELENFREAKADARTRFEEERAAAMAEARKLGCSMTRERVDALGASLDAAAMRAGGINTGGFDEEVGHAASVVCVNQTRGPIPEFELSLIAMTEGELDPCTNDVIAADMAEKTRASFSQEDYDRMASLIFDDYQGAGEAAKVKCLLARIEHRLVRGPGAAKAVRSTAVAPPPPPPPPAPVVTAKVEVPPPVTTSAPQQPKPAHDEWEGVTIDGEARVRDAIRLNVTPPDALVLLRRPEQQLFKYAGKATAFATGVPLELEGGVCLILFRKTGWRDRVLKLTVAADGQATLDVTLTK